MAQEEFNGKNIPEYASLLSDPGFKAVLGAPWNKEILRQLINLLLPEDRQVVEIEKFENRETDGFTPFTKSLRVDVRVKDIHGRTFTVEMQRKMHDSFVERCIWYGAKSFGYDLPPGSEYEDLKPVYVIAFLEEQIRHADESLWDEDHFISCYQMIEKRTGEFAPDTIFCIFVELGRFRKTEALLASTLEKTCYLFRNSGRWKGNIPEAVTDDDFTKQLADACRVENFPPDTKLNYIKEMFTEMDYKAEIKAYYKDGFAAGQVEGRMEGRKETAKNLFGAGVAPETIASCTGLSLEEVLALA